MFVPAAVVLQQALRIKVPFVRPLQSLAQPLTGTSNATTVRLQNYATSKGLLSGVCGVSPREQRERPQINHDDEAPTIA
jgi:hypothetical protein